MFLLRDLLPAALITSRRVADAHVARACDASLAEPARVAAVRALHGLPFDHALREVAGRLARVLNEPLWWLPSEVASLLALARPLVHVGVVNGRFVVSRTEPRNIVADIHGSLYCAELGEVALLRDVNVLADRVPHLPWLHGSRGDL